MPGNSCFQCLHEIFTVSNSHNSTHSSKQFLMVVIVIVIVTMIENDPYFLGIIRVLVFEQYIFR